MRFGKPATPVAKRSCYQCSNGKHDKCVRMGCGCCDAVASEEPELLKPNKRVASTSEGIGIWNRQWSSKEEEYDAIAHSILQIVKGLADYAGVPVIR